MIYEDESGNKRWTPEVEDLFEMTNLFPRTTHLPFTVWISPKGKAKHGPRIKVDSSPEAIVSVEDAPRLIHGDLSSKDFQKIKEWIILNKEALLRHWNLETDGSEVVKELKVL